MLVRVTRRRKQNANTYFCIAVLKKSSYKNTSLLVYLFFVVVFSSVFSPSRCCLRCSFQVKLLLTAPISSQKKNGKIKPQGTQWLPQHKHHHLLDRMCQNLSSKVSRVGVHMRKGMNMKGKSEGNSVFNRIHHSFCRE